MRCLLAAVRVKLGGDGGGGLLDPPPRPRGMHRRRYGRLCAELTACQFATIRAFAAEFERIAAQWTGRAG